MTGITKDELMQMASDAGLSFLEGSARAEFEDYIDDELIEFANAILERAAKDCDNAATQSGNTAKASAGIKDFRAQLVAEGAKAQASRLAQHLRDLKINTGD